MEVDGCSNEKSRQCHHREYQYSAPPEGGVEGGCTKDCQNDGETAEDPGRSRRELWFRRLPQDWKTHPRIRPSQQNLNDCAHARRKNQQDNAKNLDNTHDDIIA